MKTISIGDTVYPVRGLTTLFGAAVLLISLSIDFTYGKWDIFFLIINRCSRSRDCILLISTANLNTYIISYLRVDHPDVSYADWVIVSTTKPVILGLFMTFSGEVSRRIGLKLSIGIGAAIYRLVEILIYFLLRKLVYFLLLFQHWCLGHWPGIGCQFVAGDHYPGSLPWVGSLSRICAVH